MRTTPPCRQWLGGTGETRSGGTRPAITGPQADVPRTFTPRYPSAYIFPFHYKHPVTGKKTSEDERNASIDGVKDWKYS